MTLSRFRNHRSGKGRQPVFDGDFDDGHAVTEVIQAIPERVGTPLWSGLPPGRAYSGPAPLTVVSVTVGDGTGSDQDGARLHAALTYIRLKVAILEASGHAHRIDEAEHARRRGDPLAARSTAREICREATALLRGPEAGVR